MLPIGSIFGRTASAEMADAYDEAPALVSVQTA
jgi:hypothetical protein